MRTGKIAVKCTGRNNIGCYTYKWRWCAYVRDERREGSYGKTMRVNGKDVPVRIAFIGTKRELNKWMEELEKSQDQTN